MAQLSRTCPSFPGPASRESKLGPAPSFKQLSHKSSVGGASTNGITVYISDRLTMAYGKAEIPSKIYHSLMQGTISGGNWLSVLGVECCIC